MKLIKITKDGEMDLYFSTLTKAANFIGTSVTSIRANLAGMCKQCKGYVISQVDDDYVLSKYIDRETAPENELDKLDYFELLTNIELEIDAERSRYIRTTRDEGVYMSEIAALLLAINEIREQKKETN